MGEPVHQLKMFARAARGQVLFVPGAEGLQALNAGVVIQVLKEGDGVAVLVGRAVAHAVAVGVVGPVGPHRHHVAQVHHKGARHRVGIQPLAAGGLYFQANKAGVKTKFFLFADEGYPPYGTTIVSTTKLVAEKPDVVQRFVRASIEGWKAYLANPAAGNVLIKQDNPKMDDEQITFAIQRMKELKVFDGGDAAKLGAGVMTDARWKQTYDFMVGAGLLKAETDWKKAYTTQFVKDLKVMP